MNETDSWRLAELGQRAAELVHQLRQPLFTAKGLVQLAQNDPERAQAHLAVAESQLAVLESLLASWADLGRKPSDEDELFDVRAPVMAALVLLRHRAARVGVSLSEAVGEGAVVRGSALALQQAVSNLGNNAIEALSSGGTLRISVDATGVTIEDDGPGLPPEVRLRLFEPFLTTRADGTGLGLVVARRMVERNRATLELEASAVGVRWRIRLPSRIPE